MLNKICSVIWIGSAILNFGSENFILGVMCLLLACMYAGFAEYQTNERIEELEKELKVIKKGHF